MTRFQVAAALVLLGVVSAMAGVAFFGTIYLTGESTTARVVEHRWQSVDGTRMCSPVFAYEVDGRAYSEVSMISSGDCSAEVGGEVTVYYRSESPADPYPGQAGAFLPLLIPLGLFAAAGYVALRKPKLSEQIAEAEEGTIEGARDGDLVKLRGRLSLAPAASPVRAPLTERPCVAWWTRVMEGEPGKKAETILAKTHWAAFVVRCSDGEARVSADTPVKLGIEADFYGSTHAEPFGPLEGFLEAHGLSAEPATFGAHHIWFQGVFRDGEEVFVLGRARRVGDGVVELSAAKEDRPVVLQHVDREDRKAAGPAPFS